MKVGASLPPRPAGAPALAPPARPTPGRAFHEVLTEGAPRPATAHPAARTARAEAASTAPAASPLARGLARALAGAAAGEARIDALLDAAARGKTFTAGELLAMQVTAFRYSQTIEVLSRATDRLVGAVNQTLGTQV